MVTWSFVSFTQLEEANAERCDRKKRHIRDGLEPHCFMFLEDVFTEREREDNKHSRQSSLMLLACISL